ncbi:MAG: hypothetical protein GTO63_02410, partial [Anaerolineae bacterium]|nr:hypothetical protein [Anaerolineae bacterium]NIN93913.1 hypothetical protein [Anaerolineae bacterium]NIQ76944.1 hypothetical protein [Anaerolineae bacterium]
CGNRRCERGAYPWLWEPFVYIENMGYLLKWHWMERDRMALNRLADFISRLCRVRTEELKPEIEDKLGAPMEELVYDFNPTEDFDALIQGEA